MGDAIQSDAVGTSSALGALPLGRVHAVNCINDTPIKTPPVWLELPANVTSKISLGSPWQDRGPCWEWTAAKTNGYGIVQYDGRTQRAHRVVYACLRAPIPDELELDHLCRNRGCVNPDHTEPVTGIVNNARSNSASAIHARQTHCKRGHEFTPDNTYRAVRERGKQERFCRECSRIRDRERYARKKATSSAEIGGGN
jgi:hypothetical protein